MAPSDLSNQPLLRSLRGEIQSRPPWWLMRQAGRYLPEYRALRSRTGTFLDLCYTPDLACEVTLQPIRRFHPDAAILFSDILVVPDAMGQEVGFKPDHGPVLTPIRDRGAIKALTAQGMVEALAPVYQAIAQIRTALPKDVTLIGFAGAPWTVATYMVEGGTSRDFRTVKGWAYADPLSFQSLIDLLVEATISHLDAQVNAGAQVLQLFESWAGILPAAAFGRWCVRPVADIVAVLKKRHPEVPIIAFPRGAGILYDGYGDATGVDCVGLDAMVPLDWAAHTLQGKTALQGNLDPIMLCVGGAPMAAAVGEILTALNVAPFIFNLGHGVLPQTPIAHVEALAGLLRDH